MQDIVGASEYFTGFRLKNNYTLFIRMYIHNYIILLDLLFDYQTLWIFVVLIVAFSRFFT